jgi:hypothetical protein
VNRGFLIFNHHQSPIQMKRWIQLRSPNRADIIRQDAVMISKPSRFTTGRKQPFLPASPSGANPSTSFDETLSTPIVQAQVFGSASTYQGGPPTSETKNSAHKLTTRLSNPCRLKNWNSQTLRYTSSEMGVRCTL